jgi:hypothetical protein
MGLARARRWRLAHGALRRSVLPDPDGKTITVEWLEGKGKGHARVSIPAGKHLVQVALNGVQVTGQEVTVTSGQETWFKVNYQATLPGTVKKPGTEQADQPPVPQAALRPTVPTDARLFAGKYHKAFNESLSWHQARGKCRDIGGHLAIVRDESENRFITSLLVDADIESAWLGPTDEKLEGRFVCHETPTRFSLSLDPGSGMKPGGKALLMHKLVSL